MLLRDERTEHGHTLFALPIHLQEPVHLWRLHLDLRDRGRTGSGRGSAESFQFAFEVEGHGRCGLYGCAERTFKQTRDGAAYRAS